MMCSSPGCSLFTRATSDSLKPVWSTDSAVAMYLPLEERVPSTARLSPVHAVRRREVFGSKLRRMAQEPEVPGAKRESASVCVFACLRALSPSERMSSSSCLNAEVIAISMASGGGSLLLLCPDWKSSDRVRTTYGTRDSRSTAEVAGPLWNVLAVV